MITFHTSLTVTAASLFFCVVGSHHTEHISYLKALSAKADEIIALTSKKYKQSLGEKKQQDSFDFFRPNLLEGEVQSCLGYFLSENQEDSEDESLSLECEFSDARTYPVTVTKSWIETQVEEGLFRSGIDHIVLPTGTRLVKDELRIPPGSNVLIKHIETDERAIPGTLGTHTVLVVRVEAGDSNTTETRDELSDDFFGNGLVGEHLHNIKTRYAACSYGELVIEPVSDRSPVDGSSDGIAYGVTTVSVINNVKVDKRGTVVNAILSALQIKFGVNNYRELANHVIICFPGGTKGWIAYAMVGGARSVFNGNYDQSVTSSVHEIGHNLGLSHSGQNGRAYRDTTGMMGISYAGDNNYNKCFNAAKNWQLGWYADRQLEIEPVSGEESNLRLIGIADYKNDSEEGKIVIKISTGELTDFYVGFNRKTGINEDTNMAINQVTVVNAPNKGQSWLMAMLSEGETYEVENFGGGGGTLIIEVEEIDLDANPAFATVSVVLG